MRTDYGENMSTNENTPEKELDRRRVAQNRAERWERAIQDSGHEYTPTEETTLRRNSEIVRDEKNNDHVKD